MPDSCCAYGCTNRRKKGGNLQFFSFPLNREDVLKKWLIAVRRAHFVPTKYTKICSEHFSPDAYADRPGINVPYLKDDAVPSIFKGFPSHLQKQLAKPVTENRSSPIKQVAYKRKRLRDGAVPCYFPSDNNSYSRKRRKSDANCDAKIRKILAKTAESYSENLVVYPDTLENSCSDSLNSYSNNLSNYSDSGETDVGEVEEHCNEYDLDKCSDKRRDIGSEDEVKYIDILNRSRLFDDIWNDPQIVDLPSKSWAIFPLQPNEERKIVITQMGFSSVGVPVPAKQICLDSEMNVDLYFKNAKLHFDEMNIKPPKMITVDDVSSFIKSVDGLVDWE